MISKECVLQRGTQIVYTPLGTEGNIHHERSENGVVINDIGSYAMCLFFYKDGKLRTRHNTEMTPKEYMVIYNHKNEKEIVELVKKY